MIRSAVGQVPGVGAGRLHLSKTPPKPVLHDEHRHDVGAKYTGSTRAASTPQQYTPGPASASPAGTARAIFSPAPTVGGTPRTVLKSTPHSNGKSTPRSGASTPRFAKRAMSPEELVAELANIEKERKIDEDIHRRQLKKLTDEKAKQNQEVHKARRELEREILAMKHESVRQDKFINKLGGDIQKLSRKKDAKVPVKKDFEQKFEKQMCEIDRKHEHLEDQYLRESSRAAEVKSKLKYLQYCKKKLDQGIILDFHSPAAEGKVGTMGTQVNLRKENAQLKLKVIELQKRIDELEEQLRQYEAIGIVPHVNFDTRESNATNVSNLSGFPHSSIEALMAKSSKLRDTVFSKSSTTSVPKFSLGAEGHGNSIATNSKDTGVFPDGIIAGGTGGIIGQGGSTIGGNIGGGNMGSNIGGDGTNQGSAVSHQAGTMQNGANIRGSNTSNGGPLNIVNPDPLTNGGPQASFLQRGGGKTASSARLSAPRSITPTTDRLSKERSITPVDGKRSTSEVPSMLVRLPPDRKPNSPSSFGKSPSVSEPTDRQSMSYQGTSVQGSKGPSEMGGSRVTSLIGSKSSQQDGRMSREDTKEYEESSKPSYSESKKSHGDSKASYSESKSSYAGSKTSCTASKSSYPPTNASRRDSKDSSLEKAKIFRRESKGDYPVTKTYSQDSKSYRSKTGSSKQTTTTKTITTTRTHNVKTHGSATRKKSDNFNMYRSDRKSETLSDEQMAVDQIQMRATAPTAFSREDHTQHQHSAESRATAPALISGDPKVHYMTNTTAQSGKYGSQKTNTTQTQTTQQHSYQHHLYTCHQNSSQTTRQSQIASNNVQKQSVILNAGSVILDTIVSEDDDRMSEDDEMIRNRELALLAERMKGNIGIGDTKVDSVTQQEEAKENTIINTDNNVEKTITGTHTMSSENVHRSVYEEEKPLPPIVESQFQSWDQCRTWNQYEGLYNGTRQVQCVGSTRVQECVPTSMVAQPDTIKEQHGNLTQKIYTEGYTVADAAVANEYIHAAAINKVTTGMTYHVIPERKILVRETAPPTAGAVYRYTDANGQEIPSGRVVNSTSNFPEKMQTNSTRELQMSKTRSFKGDRNAGSASIFESNVRHQYAVTAPPGYPMPHVHSSDGGSKRASKTDSLKQYQQTHQWSEETTRLMREHRKKGEGQKRNEQQQQRTEHYQQQSLEQQLQQQRTEQHQYLRTEQHHYQKTEQQQQRTEQVQQIVQQPQVYQPSYSIRDSQRTPANTLSLPQDTTRISSCIISASRSPGGATSDRVTEQYHREMPSEMETNRQKTFIVAPNLPPPPQLRPYTSNSGVPSVISPAASSSVHSGGLPGTASVHSNAMAGTTSMQSNGMAGTTSMQSTGMAGTTSTQGNGVSNQKHSEAYSSLLTYPFDFTHCIGRATESQVYQPSQSASIIQPAQSASIIQPTQSASIIQHSNGMPAASVWMGDTMPMNSHLIGKNTTYPYEQVVHRITQEEPACTAEQLRPSEGTFVQQHLIVANEPPKANEQVIATRQFTPEQQVMNNMPLLRDGPMATDQQLIAQQSSSISKQMSMESTEKQNGGHMNANTLREDMTEGHGHEMSIHNANPPCSLHSRPGCSSPGNSSMHTSTSGDSSSNDRLDNSHNSNALTNSHTSSKSIGHMGRSNGQNSVHNSQRQGSVQSAGRDKNDHSIVNESMHSGRVSNILQSSDLPGNIDQSMEASVKTREHEESEGIDSDEAAEVVEQEIAEQILATDHIEDVIVSGGGGESLVDATLPKTGSKDRFVKLVRNLTAKALREYRKNHRRTLRGSLPAHMCRQTLLDTRDTQASPDHNVDVGSSKARESVETQVRHIGEQSMQLVEQPRQSAAQGSVQLSQQSLQMGTQRVQSGEQNMQLGTQSFISCADSVQIGTQSVQIEANNVQMGQQSFQMGTQSVNDGEDVDMRVSAEVRNTENRRESSGVFESIEMLEQGRTQAVPSCLENYFGEQGPTTDFYSSQYPPYNTGILDSISESSKEERPSQNHDFVQQ